MEPRQPLFEPEIGATPAPLQRIGWGFIALYAIGYTGIWLALLTPMLVSIALRLRQLSPDTATADLALVLSAGAVFAVIGNPVFGHLSDRTRSRFGRRRPWMAGGMLCGSAALLVIALAQSVALVLVGWCVAQLAFNAVLASMVAIFPDQVPEAQRGTVSGVIAVTLPLGQALGTVIVRAVSDSAVLSFMIPAAVGTLVVFLLAAVVSERPSDGCAAPPTRLSASIRAFWSDPRPHPDFAWACASRFLLAMGSAFITTYQPYYLMENFGFGDREVAGRLSEAVVIQTLLIIACGLLAGRLSDFIQRRKPFVFAGAALYAVGLWLIAHAGTFEEFVVGMAATGIGHGIYFGVDLALVTGILRTRQHASGKDLGLLNVANTLPQIITPALGSLVLMNAGKDYGSLFVVAGCVAVLSSIAILPLRTVR